MPDWGRCLLVASIVVFALVLVAAGCRRLGLRLEHFTIAQTRPVLSQVDGIEYRVHPSHEGPQGAADLLARINGRVVELMRHLRAAYVRGPAGARHPRRQQATNRMLARYNPDNLAENSPLDPTGDTAYSLDKGAVVALCLRARGEGGHELHDLSTVTFVTLHELTHIAIDAIDHPPEFWATFKWVLAEAEVAGVFTAPDYASSPVVYCGMRIDYNPHRDAGLQSI